MTYTEYWIESEDGSWIIAVVRQWYVFGGIDTQVLPGSHVT